jgi:hypothetical protein
MPKTVGGPRQYDSYTVPKEERLHRGVRGTRLLTILILVAGATSIATLTTIKKSASLSLGIVQASGRRQKMTEALFACFDQSSLRSENLTV